MTNKNLEKKIAELKELENMKKELEAEMEAIKDEIKAEMGVRNTDEIMTGAFTVRYKEVVQSRFDSKAFKEKHSKLYAKFLKPTSSMRFTVA